MSVIIVKPTSDPNVKTLFKTKIKKLSKLKLNAHYRIKK